MKVTLKNKKVAAAALEIMKARLTAGFDCDKNYRRTPSMRMCEDLEVVKNTIVLPEDCGYYFADDAAKVIPELMKELAAHLSGESFTFGTCNSMVRSKPLWKRLFSFGSGCGCPKKNLIS